MKKKTKTKVKGTKKPQGKIFDQFIINFMIQLVITITMKHSIRR